MEKQHNRHPGVVTAAYIKSFRRKLLLLILPLGGILLVAVLAVMMGSYDVPVKSVFRALTGNADATTTVVIANIRLPRVVAAIACGWGLSLSGLSLQSLLKNPLGAPSTLGISQGAALGAAAAIVVFGTKTFSVTLFAFGGALAATIIVLILSGLKRLSSEAVILAGVALSSLFVSATILIQYLATETQLAMVVFWTFGDVARSNWREISLLTVTVKDMAGRQVTAPFDPERIVCIGPGALRLIVYLQASSKVSGVEDMEKMNPGGRPYWIAHPELSRLPRCGPGGPASINKKPDLEAVLASKPQVIFSTYMDAPLAEEVQRTLGIPLVVLNYGAFATFDEAVYDALRIAGRILNREKRAQDVVAYIDNLRKDMSERTRDIPEESKPEVYIGGIGYQGSRGIESTEQNYIPFKWVGAKNAAERSKASIGSHVDMDKEMLLKLNPDVIFIDSNGLNLVREDFRKKPEYYHALKAFSNRRAYILHPFNWYATNIDTALADAYVVGKILYKKQFEDVDPHQMAEKIYAFLVGKSVVGIMEKEYGLNGQAAAF